MHANMGDQQYEYINMIDAFLQTDDFEFLDDNMKAITEDQNHDYHRQSYSSSASTSRIISFGNNQDSTFTEHEKEVMMMSAAKMKMSDHNDGSRFTASPAVTQLQPFDHVIAERKRRERLNELMATLSSIIPGLKRHDKSSVLGEAVRYLKDLKERVKLLENEDRINISQKIVVQGRYRSSEEHSSSQIDKFRFEIEARILKNNVLIKVHCKKKNGMMMKMLKEIEKNDLVMVNNSIMHFGNYSMEMTIVAEMNSEYNLTIEDLVKNLQTALL